MEQAFYASDEIFADVEAVMMPEWHFAGLANEIPGAGDYIVDLLDESVILVRGKMGGAGLLQRLPAPRLAHLPRTP